MHKKKIVIKTIIIVLLLLLIGISTFFGCYFYNMKGNNLSLENISINENSNISYNIKMLNEEYYNDLNNDTYLTKFIDDIKASFYYTKTFSNKVKGEYNYYVVGKLLTKTDDSDYILNRDLYKSDTYKYELDGNIINLSSNFDIDVDNYKKIYDELVSSYDLNLEGYISFDVVISYHLYDNKIDKSLNDRRVLNIKLPISRDATKIEKTPRINMNEKEYKDGYENYDKLLLMISCEFFGADILFILIIILLIKDINDEDSLYERQKRKILKKYEQIIIHVKSLPEIDDENVLFVDKISELASSAYKLNSPINYIEVIKGKESVFMILDDKKVYVYKLK